MLYDRIFLAGLIVGVWSLVKLTEELLPDKALYYLPKPFALYAIFVMLVAMVIHTIWFALSQRRKGFFKTRFESADSKIPTLSSYPDVDIFVPIHNEEKVLANTIENLLGLNYPNYKIYLIDDHSTDATKKIIEKYEKLFPLKIQGIYISEDDIRGKAAALNHAFFHSSGELIAVFDADARMESDFLLEMIPYLEDDLTSAVQSQKRISNPTEIGRAHV